MIVPAFLPSIILLRILRYATYDVADGLQEWKHGLRLLGICHPWRVQAQRLIYSYLFIGDKAKCYTPELLRIPPSNIALTKQVGIECFVSTLSIVQHIDKCPLELLQSIYDMLNLQQHLWPQIKTLKLHTRFTRTSHNSNSSIDNSTDDSLVRTIAESFIHNMPCINTLIVEARQPDPEISTFLGMLVCGYCMRLERFSHTGQPRFKLPTALKISHLLLHLSEDSTLWLSLVNPCQLQHVSLYNASPTQSRRFLTKNSTKSTVTFECLKRLVLSNIGLSSLHTQRSHRHQLDTTHQHPLVQFPRLKILVLEGVCLDACMLQNLLQPPLRILYICWWLIDFVKYNIPDLLFLDKLVVVCDVDQVRNMEEFYQRTNSIFAATKGIREVQLKIYTLCDIDAMQVYWPHLDYLEICTAVNIETALTLASRAPGLTHLKINNLIPPEQTQQRSDLSAGIEKSVQLNHRQKNSEIRAVSFAFKPEGTSTARELMIAILRTHLPKLEQVC